MIACLSAELGPPIRACTVEPSAATGAMIRAWTHRPQLRCGGSRRIQGGHYRETYRSEMLVELPGWTGPRALATSILYLLAEGEASAWHRVRGEELWCWQGGDSMVVSVGENEYVLGPDRPAGQELQVLVPAGVWQRATPAAGASGWSLVACLVAPGFDFADFELRGD